MTNCVLCDKEVKGNVNPENTITCSDCVQKLLNTPMEKRRAIYDTLIQKGFTEKASILSSWIAEKEMIVDETRKSRPDLDRGRVSKKVRTSH